MSRRPTRSTRTDTPFPFPALFRAAFAEAKPLRLRAGRSTHAGPASALALVSARRGLAAGLFRLGLAALGFARSLLRRLRLLLRRLLLLLRSEEHTSELQSLMRISYAVFCLKKKKTQHTTKHA